MKLLGIIARSIFALILLSVLSMFQVPIEKHLEIGTQNLSKKSETFVTVNKYVIMKHKDYNEYLNTTFR